MNKYIGIRVPPDLEFTPAPSSPQLVAYYSAEPLQVLIPKLINNFFVPSTRNK